VRIAVENKSVITAHRNRTNRFDDLSKSYPAIHSARPEALLVATVLVGLAQRVLNIPDQYTRFSGIGGRVYGEGVAAPFLGDTSLWTEFSWAISKESKSDPARTIELLQKLPTRKPGHTHVAGYDFVLLVPVISTTLTRRRCHALTCAG